MDNLKSIIDEHKEWLKTQGMTLEIEEIASCFSCDQNFLLQTGVDDDRGYFCSNCSDIDKSGY